MPRPSLWKLPLMTRPPSASRRARPMSSSELEDFLRDYQERQRQDDEVPVTPYYPVGQASLPVPVRE